MRRFAIGLVIVLVAAACGDDDSASTTTAVEGTEVTSAPTTVARVTSASTTATTAITEAPATTAAATTSPASPPCSAQNMVVTLADEPDLSVPADAMRRAIVSTATACDIDTLAALGLEGVFEWSYNPNAAGDPAEHWRFMEFDFGATPLAGLVELFSFPFGVQQVAGVPIYIWPSAAAYDSWASVPAAERAALAGLFTAGDLEAFAAEDLYLGQHLGIDANGDWRWYFTSGN